MENKKQKRRPTLCIDLLNTFSKKELTGFTDFLTCHYFNTDKIVVQLFRALHKYVIQKHFFDANLQSRIYEVVFKKASTEIAKLSKAQKTQLNRKLSLLLRLAEEFIAINNLRANKYSDIDYLYPTLLKRRQHSLFKKHFKKMDTEFEQVVEKDIFYYHNLSSFYGLQLDHLNNLQELEKGNIEEYIKTIDLCYLSKRLSIHQTVLSFNKYRAKNINPMMYKPIKKLLVKSAYKRNSLLKLYQANIELIKQMMQAEFETLINLIKSEGNEISKNDLLGLYYSAINFCSFKIRKGDTKYYQYSFNLYLEMHAKNLLINEDFLNGTAYTNIITIGCHAKQFEWAKKLCEYYRPYLISSNKESIYKYNMGLIAFFKKDYTEAHSKFAQTFKTNISIDFSVRLYILKCLFETSTAYSYQFLQTLRRAKEFFKNQKNIPSQRKKAYLNFLKILVNLYHYIYKKRKISIITIEEQLENMEIVNFRAWLKEKINDLKF